MPVIQAENLNNELLNKIYELEKRIERNENKKKFNYNKIKYFIINNKYTIINVLLFILNLYFIYKNIFHNDIFNVRLTTAVQPSNCDNTEYFDYYLYNSRMIGQIKHTEKGSIVGVCTYSINGADYFLWENN